MEEGRGDKGMEYSSTEGSLTQMVSIVALSCLWRQMQPDALMERRPQTVYHPIK